MVDGQWTDDGPWLYYKLTNEPKGSGELKTCCGYLLESPRRYYKHPVGLDCLPPCFMCANSEGCGETARMRRLA